MPDQLVLVVDSRIAAESGFRNNGSVDEPFATLDQAFRAIVSTGYNSTCIVLLKGETTLWPSRLDTGHLGAQASPVTIAPFGELVVIRAKDTVCSVSEASGLAIIRTSGLQYTQADVGRIVRFASFDAWIAEINGPNELVLAFPSGPTGPSGIESSVGQEFAVLALPACLLAAPQPIFSVTASRGLVLRHVTCVVGKSFTFVSPYRPVYCEATAFETTWSQSAPSLRFQCALVAGPVPSQPGLQLSNAAGSEFFLQVMGGLESSVHGNSLWRNGVAFHGSGCDEICQVVARQNSALTFSSGSTRVHGLILQGGIAVSDTARCHLSDATIANISCIRGGSVVMHGGVSIRNPTRGALLAQSSGSISSHPGTEMPSVCFDGSAMPLPDSVLIHADNGSIVFDAPHAFVVQTPAGPEQLRLGSVIRAEGPLAVCEVGAMSFNWLAAETVLQAKRGAIVSVRGPLASTGSDNCGTLVDCSQGGRVILNGVHYYATAPADWAGCVVACTDGGSCEVTGDLRLDIATAGSTTLPMVLCDAGSLVVRGDMALDLTDISSGSQQPSVLVQNGAALECSGSVVVTNAKTVSNMPAVLMTCGSTCVVGSVVEIIGNQGGPALHLTGASRLSIGKHLAVTQVCGSSLCQTDAAVLVGEASSLSATGDLIVDACELTLTGLTVQNDAIATVGATLQVSGVSEGSGLLVIGNGRMTVNGSTIASANATDGISLAFAGQLTQEGPIDVCGNGRNGLAIDTNAKVTCSGSLKSTQPNAQLGVVVRNGGNLLYPAGAATATGKLGHVQNGSTPIATWDAVRRFDNGSGGQGSCVVPF